MKKFFAMLLSVLMIATMMPMQAFASEECNHMITAAIWANLPNSVKEANPDKEPNANGNGDEVPAFVNAKLPASCEEDGWELRAGDDHGFCFLCGEIIPSDTGASEYEIIPATGHNCVETTAPTCTQEGVATCQNKVYTYKPTGSPGNYSPTYEESECGYTESIDKLPHNMGEWTTIVEPKCTLPGYEERVCLNESGSDVYTERNNLEAKGHVWDEGVVTAPTCTDDGYTTYTCTVCGETKKEDGDPATGHDWSDWTVTKQTSCAEAGIETRVCQNDKSHVETREIAKLPHNYGEVQHVDPTCTEDGYDVEICSACGYEHRFNQEKYPATGHDLGDDAVVEEEPTCTKDGIAVGTCKNCGEKQVRTVIDALGHDFGEWTVETPATCTDDGLEVQKCSRCDAENTNVIPALGHDWGEWQVTKEATCTEAGSKKRVCNNDDSHIETETIPANDHQWDEGVVTEPTCTKGGYTTYTCTVCGVTEVRDETAKLGHDPDMTQRKVVKAPTCEADGYDEAPCTRCDTIVRIITPAIGHDYVANVVEPGCETQGYTEYVCQNDSSHNYKTDFKDALGHDWDAGVVTKAAECEETGTKLYTCQREPSHTYVQTLPAINHDWQVDQVVDPTCTNDGYTEYVCANDPSHTKTDDIVPALGHNYDVDGDGVDDYDVTTPATCTSTGVETATCTRCHNEITRDIPMVPHQFTATRISWPTCTTQGEIIYTCQVCGLIEQSFDDPTGHSFDNDSDLNCLHGKNCTNVDKNTGIVCGAEDDSRDYSVTFAENVKTAPNGAEASFCVDGYNFDPDTDVVATGHDYEWVFHEATCEQDAYWIGTCVRERVLDDGTVVKCPENEDVVNDVIRVDCMNTAIGHRWSLLDDGSCVEPTCTEDGVRKYICLNDHAHTYTETIPATGHQFVLDTEQSVAPTCGEDGKNVYTCVNVNNVKGEVCGESYIEVVPATGEHKYSAASTAATCTEEGFDTYTCDVCGHTYTVTTTPATGHQFVEDASQFVAPTCNTDGKRVFVCVNTYLDENGVTQICGDSYEIIIPATGNHNYTLTSTTPATCTEEGTATYTCQDEGCTAAYTVATTPATGHQFVEDSAQYVAPTCTEEGQRVYVCVNENGGKGCDKTYVSKIPATGHNYGKTEVVAPTCTAEGYTKHICTNPDCDDYYVNEYTSKIPHVMSVAETKAATCGEDGYVTYTCANCEYSYQEILPATGNHQYVETVTVQPTCDTTGVMTYVCKVCGYTYTEELPKTGHTAVSADNAVAPTCTTAGHQSDTICEVCGKTLETGAKIQPTGHNYGKVVVVAPTCTAEGYTKHICTNPDCDDYYVNEYTSKIPHVMSVAETKAATCGEDGYVTYTCANCEYSYQEILPATGNHQYVETVTTAATCTTDGVMTHSCKDCDYSYTTVIPATGEHSYVEHKEKASNDDNYPVTELPTCITEGQRVYICDSTYTDENGEEKTCNNVYIEVLPKLNHDYTYVETAATCTAQGKIVATCKNCGDVQTYTIPATGHIYDSQGVYTAPTCVEDGYITYTCVVCKKASVTKTEGKAAGHVYKASVTNPAAVNANGTITTACIHCGKSSVETIPAISKVTLSETVYIYNGKACRPSVTVYDTKGNKIDKSNYTVSYSSNKAIGSAKVTVTFKGGKYTGKIVKSFKIVPKNVGISDISTKSKSIRFTWGKVAKCDGYQIQYSTSKTFKSKKTVTIKSRKTCTKNLTGLKSGKTYYIRVRAYKIVDGKKIYGYWSTATKKCK